MKRRILHLGLIGIMLLATGLTAVAATGTGKRDGDGSRWDKGKCCRGDHMARLVEKLDLSQEQQQQVDKIFAAHRDQAGKLRSQMSEVRGKLHQAMNPKAFDEKALRQAAAEKAKIQTELMVGRARTHSQVYALLTPEQQERADKARDMQRLRGEGGKRFHHRGNHGFECPNPQGMGPKEPQAGQ